VSMKIPHAYRTTEARVILGGYPIVSADCGHVNGNAFGRVLKVIEGLRDCPAHDVASAPVAVPGWSLSDLARLRASVEMSA